MSTIVKKKKPSGDNLNRLALAKDGVIQTSKRITKNN